MVGFALITADENVARERRHNGEQRFLLGVTATVKLILAGRNWGSSHSLLQSGHRNPDIS